MAGLLGLLHCRAQRPRPPAPRSVAPFRYSDLDQPLSLSHHPTHPPKPTKPTQSTDSSVLSLLDDKREYGKQRLWGQFGFGLAGCIVGPCLMNHKFGGYKAAFYVHALISLPTFLIMRRFDPTPRKAVADSGKSKKPAKKAQVQPRFREGLGLVVRNPDNLIFFLMGAFGGRGLFVLG